MFSMSKCIYQKFYMTRNMILEVAFIKEQVSEAQNIIEQKTKNRVGYTIQKHSPKATKEDIMQQCIKALHLKQQALQKTQVKLEKKACYHLQVLIQSRKPKERRIILKKVAVIRRKNVTIIVCVSGNPRSVGIGRNLRLLVNQYNFCVCFILFYYLASTFT